MSGSFINCAQCAGHTKQGTRCKNRTCLYAKFCNQHTEDVIIKKSQIPKTGNGLFAKHVFEKGETIGRYKGEKMTLAEFEGQDPESDYGYQWKKGHVIDAKKSQSCNARNINDARGSKFQNNARFSTSRGKVKVVAKKRINRLKEIFISYGPAYWR